MAASAAAEGPLDRFLANYYRQHREFGSRDRRFFSNIIFAWFRWRGWLPETIRAYAALAVVGALEGLAPHPVLSYLAKQAHLPEPFVLEPGSTLLQIAQQLKQYLSLPKTPALSMLLPSWVREELFYPENCLPDKYLLTYAEAAQNRPPTWIRLDGYLGKTLPKLPLDSKRHPVIPQAVELPAKLPPDYVPDQEKFLELQDLASQAVGLICDPKLDSSWWDICAGAGGKTLHLADLMRGTGEIWATDIRPHSLAALQRRRGKHLPAKIVCKPWSGEEAKLPPDRFDGVLVDAPCSGLGTWGRNPDARWRLDSYEIDSYAARQLRLLEAAAAGVRPGGSLVYAVCTLTAKETVGVVEKFALSRPNFALDPVKNPITEQLTDGRVWIWPWTGRCNGMFVARWERQA